MGTRADFYVGRGLTAEWIGSQEYDGFTNSLPRELKVATTEAAFRAAVERHSADRDDWIPVSRGWPWPWKTSRTTDYAVAFDNGVVYGSTFGREWYIVADGEPPMLGPKTAVFPVMLPAKPGFRSIL